VSDIGPAEILLLLLVALLFFGSKRLPEIGRSIGEGMREFRDSVSGRAHAGEDDEARAELEAATRTPPDGSAEAQPSERPDQEPEP
jgi:sec-independent protein translocase protein TatA